MIRKSNDAVRVRNIEEFRVFAGRVKSDPEWFVEISFRERFSQVRFTIAVCIAKYLDLIGATFYNEDVAIRGCEQEPRIAKAAGIQFDFKTWRNFWLRVRRPVYNMRLIDAKNIRTRLRQILYRDFTCDTWRITRPITHGRVTG